MLVGNVEVDVVDGAFVWTGPGRVDADGSPRAYAPANSGLVTLDNLGNAGSPGNWQLVTDTGKKDGSPLIQGANDPAPGYFISPSALSDATKLASDPTKYVDGWTFPYVSVPPEILEAGGRKGDACFVLNVKNAQSTAALIGDVGPHRKLGEYSCATARNLGLNDSARYGGTEDSIIRTVVFIGSTRGWPRTFEDLASQVDALLTGWKGLALVTSF